MIKVGSIIQSEYIHNGKKGALGVVLRLLNTDGELARVFYPKTRTSGWVKIEDMKLIA